MAVVVAWVDGLRGESEQVGDLLHDHVVHERAESVAVSCPGLQWAAVDHDDRGRAARGGLHPAEGDRVGGEPAWPVEQLVGGWAPPRRRTRQIESWPLHFDLRRSTASSTKSSNRSLRARAMGTCDGASGPRMPRPWRSRRRGPFGRGLPRPGPNSHSKPRSWSSDLVPTRPCPAGPPVHSRGAGVVVGTVGARIPCQAKQPVKGRQVSGITSGCHLHEELCPVVAM